MKKSTGNPTAGKRGRTKGRLARAAAIAVLMLTAACTAGCGEKSTDASGQEAGGNSVSVSDKVASEKADDGEGISQEAGTEAAGSVNAPEAAETADSAAVITGGSEEPEEIPDTLDGLIEYLNQSGYAGLKLIKVNRQDEAELLEDGDEYIVNNYDSMAIVYCSEEVEEFSYHSIYYCSTGPMQFREIGDNCYIIIVHNSGEGTITATTKKGNVYEMTNIYKFLVGDEFIKTDGSELTEEEIPKIFVEVVRELQDSGYSGLKLIGTDENRWARVLNDGDECDLSYDDGKGMSATLYYSEKAKEITDSAGIFEFDELDDNSSQIYADLAVQTGRKEITITVTTEAGNVYQITNTYIFD